MSGAVLRLDVGAEAAGQRLDAFLAQRASALTRSGWKRRIEGGAVSIDGRVAEKASLPLKAGMSVRAEIPEPPPAAIAGEAIPLTIVYEDPHLAVVDKPAGLVTHPGHGRTTGTLVHALVGRGMRLAPAGGALRPGIVHRLDKDTSGLVLVAKTDAAHRALVGAFARREVKKTYDALVWGRPSPATGRIDEAIGRSRADRTRMAVRGASARAATTLYRTVETLPSCTRLEVDLVTGRTHQIRVHFASRKHPVLGDARYGGMPWRHLRDATRREAIGSLGRLALHARAIALAHPITGAPLSLVAPFPDALAALMPALRRAP